MSRDDAGRTDADGAESPETAAARGADGDPAAAADESALGRVARRVTPDVIRRNFRAKFLISILLVVVVLAAVGGVNYASAEATVEADAERQLTATAAMHADSINEWLIAMETHARSTSSASALVGADAETAEGHLIREQAKLPVDVRAIHLVDTGSGEVVTSTTPGLRGAATDSVAAPWSDVEPGVDLTSSNDVWTSPTAYESERTDDQVMAFASPVAGDETRVVVLIGTIEYRVDNLRQLHADQETVILDAEGNEVLSGAGTDADPDAEILSALGAARDETRFERRGDTVAAYAATGDRNWIAVTTVPSEQAFAASDAVGTSVLAVVGAGLAALLVVGYALARQTVRPLRDLRDRAERMEAGDLSVSLATPRTDEFGRLYGSFAEMRDSLSETIDEAEEAQAAAERERERAAERNEALRETAADHRETMRAAADGDLTARMRTDAEADAMAEIAEAFNGMIADIEETFARLTAFADEVAAASEQVTASTEEVRETGDSIAASTDEISEGASDQSDSLQVVSGEMSDLSATIEEVASSSDQVASVASRTAETGADGREAAAGAVDEMAETEATVESAVEAIHDLESEVAEVDDLIDRIAEIADQTNMLALNANIEAARADVNGDGFAVVADEIKELSDEVMDAAESAERRIDAIRERTDASADEVESTSRKVEAAAAQVDEAVDALESIAKYAEETNDGVQEISDATEEQAASTEEVVATLDEVASVSGETAAESDTVAAAAEEQSASLAEVSDSVASLSERAAELSAALNRFEVDATVDGDGVDGVGDGVEAGSSAVATDGSGTAASGSDGADD